MNYLLHIDTSADNGMVAVTADGNVLSAKTITDSRSQAADINNLIAETLAEAGTTINALSGAVVCAGPGSYTGLRIGVATAKAICYVNDIPLFMDNKLTLLAYQALSRNSGFDKCITLIPARENEFFFASYATDMVELIAPVHVLQDELKNLIGEKKKILCVTNMNIYPDMDLGDNTVHIIYDEMLDISLWSQYAYGQFKCNGSVNLAMAEPFYLKQVYTHNSKKNN